jgi:hypothetical protein
MAVALPGEAGLRVEVDDAVDVRRCEIHQKNPQIRVTIPAPTRHKVIHRDIEARQLAWLKRTTILEAANWRGHRLGPSQNAQQAMD